MRQDRRQRRDRRQGKECGNSRQNCREHPAQRPAPAGEEERGKAIGLIQQDHARRAEVRQRCGPNPD